MIRRNIYWLTYGLMSLMLIGLSSAVLLERIFPIDTAILQSVQQLISPTMNVIMVTITRTGDPHFTVPLVFAVFALLLWKRYRSEAYVFAVNCLGGAVFSTGLKLLFGKVRPALWESPIVETTFSYPSGHALGSVVLYGFLGYLLGVRFVQWKALIYGGAIALCLAIGFSRLYLGVHWPTDLLGGYIIGFLWTSSCTYFLKRKGSHSSETLSNY